MIVFPSIDILNGKCVRLLHGDKNKVTDYGEALEKAIAYEKLGAEYLHLVDLNAAFSHEDHSNFEIIKEIIKSVNIPVQLGGGIRTEEDIQIRLSDMGAKRVVLGTVAYTNPALLKKAAAAYKGSIIVGMDALNRKIAIKGWVEITDKDIFQMADELKDIGIDTVLFTDISKDGALSGVNYELCDELTRVGKLNVIASGGVKDIEDVRKLKERNIYGVILGRSLYEKTIDLTQAIKEAK